ncbi:class I SAM-dependent methyltransferase [uncultured Nostoc sp.]|uniref:class I SAM-dependent methyltransferase n=1 Tax=uncultured Nostoc sp. TaxID=340711 RepID=UPI0035C9A9FA
MSSETGYFAYDADMERVFAPNSKETYENYLVQLEELVLQYLPKGSHIFDLCCGRGELAQLLQNKGFQVTGLDGSEVMLHYARKNAPSVEFILDDARYFKFPPTFHAVVSIYNSLTEVTILEELESIFQNVYAALLENGIFAFEAFLEEVFLPYSVPNITGDVKDDYAWIGCTTYDIEKKIFRESYTNFQFMKGEWQRSEVTLLTRAYSIAEIQSALEKVGFTEVSIYDEERDLGVEKRAGKVCIVCRKPLIA